MLLELKTIFKNFYIYLKNPQEHFKESLSIKQKCKILLSILLLDFILVIISSGIISLIDEFLFKLKSDPIENLFANKKAFSILFIAVIFTPLIEELIFRFFLKYERNLLFQMLDYFTNKKAKLFWSKHFRTFFYLSAILFALTHLTNYSNNNLIFYILAPLIILPQFIGGITLGYIRLKLGFFWGVLEHGLYNLIIFVPALLFFNISTLVSVDNPDYSLFINKLEFGLNKPSNFKRYESEYKLDSLIVNNYQIKHLAEILNSKDPILIKNSNRINLRFINKSNSTDPNTIILKELKKELDSN